MVDSLKIPPISKRILQKYLDWKHIVFDTNLIEKIEIYSKESTSKNLIQEEEYIPFNGYLPPISLDFPGLKNKIHRHIELPLCKKLGLLEKQRIKIKINQGFFLSSTYRIIYSFKNFKKLFFYYYLNNEREKCFNILFSDFFKLDEVQKLISDFLDITYDVSPENDNEEILRASNHYHILNEIDLDLFYQFLKNKEEFKEKYWNLLEEVGKDYLKVFDFNIKGHLTNEKLREIGSFFCKIHFDIDLIKKEIYGIDNFRDFDRQNAFMKIHLKYRKLKKLTH